MTLRSIIFIFFWGEGWSNAFAIALLLAVCGHSTPVVVGGI